MRNSMLEKWGHRNKMSARTYTAFKDEQFFPQAVPHHIARPEVQRIAQVRRNPTSALILSKWVAEAISNA